MPDRATILIIDDEESVLDSCARALSGMPHELITASDGVTGLRKIEEMTPDLVFVNPKAPGLSGPEVFERIEEIAPTIVAIAISGDATVGMAVDAMKRGAYEFLAKPFTGEEFRLATERGLEKHRELRETIALRHEREMLREHFAAIVAHELKSPLSSVQQNLFVLSQRLSGALSDEDEERLDRMRNRIDELMQTIHTWLGLVASDLRAIRDEFEPLDVGQVLAKAAEYVEPQAVRKDIEIVAEIPEPVGRVSGHEGMLVEAVANLLVNAVKYSRLGSQIVARVVQDDGEVVISVTDSGVGIAKEDLAFVFDDFFRGDSSEGGSGLGLSLTKRIVDTHYGSISVDSELGKGSTFAIRLPVLLEPGSEPVAHATRVSETRREREGKRKSSRGNRSVAVQLRQNDTGQRNRPTTNGDVI